MRTVTVLLTKYSDWISDIVYHIGGHGYTHASLSLEEDNDTYYSFNYKGFCVETVEKHRRRGVKKSLSYQLKVTDQAYENIKTALAKFQCDRDSLSYTRLGVLFCILRIPFHWNRHYFCSQFVAELLLRSGAVILQWPPELYLPNHFCREFSDNGQLLKIRCNPV